MKRKKTTRRPSGAGWFTLAEAQTCFGKSGEGFRKYVRPHLPEEAVQRFGNGRQTWIRMPVAIAAYVAHCVERAAPGTATDEAQRRRQTELKLRLETVRVAQAELNLEQLRGELLRVTDVRTTYELLATAVRSAAERIRSRHGPEPVAELDACLQELQTALAGLPKRKPAAEPARLDVAPAESGLAAAPDAEQREAV